MANTFPININTYATTNTTSTGTYFNSNSYTFPYYTTITIPNNIVQGNYFSIDTQTYYGQYNSFTTITGFSNPSEAPMIPHKCDLCKKDISAPSECDAKYFYLCPLCSKEMYQEMKLTANSPDHPMLVARGNEYSDAVERLRALRCPQCNEIH